MQGKDQAIFQYLQQERRLFGATLDEVIPIIILFLFFLVLGSPYIGLILSAAWFFFIRKIKKGLGSKYLIAIIYWYCPALKYKRQGKTFYKTFLVKTPPAELVHWI